MKTIHAGLKQLCVIAKMEDLDLRHNEIVNFYQQYGDISPYVKIARTLENPEFSQIAEMFCYEDCSEVTRTLCIVNETLKCNSVPHSSIVGVAFFKLVHNNISQIESDIDKLSKGLEYNYVGVINAALEELCGHKLGK